MAGWFLQFQGSKFGPLSMDEVKVILSSGKLTGPLFAWKQGMADWEAVEHLHDLAPFMSAGRRTANVDQRRATRIPFMATVKFSGAGVGQGLVMYTGICRDLSKGGMSVMSSSNPGFPGSLVTLTIEPVSDASLPRLAVEAVIVRLLKDNQGFSVRFSKLKPAQQESLAALLKAGTASLKKA